MSGNTFGTLLKVTTFGESHGPAMGAVIDGVPAGLELNVAKDIQPLVDARRPGGSIFVSPRQEEDKVEVLSGVYNHKTLGTPICLIIRNNDCRSKDYSKLKDVFRPGHGDLTWQAKFGLRDHRGGGRSSARETVARVAAGAIALKILATQDITLGGYLTKIGTLKAADPLMPESHALPLILREGPFVTTDSTIIPQWQQLLHQLKQKGDSVGAQITVVAANLPLGLGEPVFDKLDAELAKSLMSIPAVKAVEVGLGVRAAEYLGSEASDEILPYQACNLEPTTLTEGTHQLRFSANHSGGTQGGISNSNHLMVSITFKPTSSIAITKRTLTKKLEQTLLSTTGRHDPCVGLRAVPIAEAMVALTLADLLLRHRARAHFI